MSVFGRVLGLFLCLGLTFGAADVAAAGPGDKPVVGAFVTLEKTSSGFLKYGSTKAGGAVEILDLPNGKYRMSITPPSGDKGSDFAYDVSVEFTNLRVDGWAKRSRAKAESAGGETNENGLYIPAQLWTRGVLWLDVTVTDRTVTGVFQYLE